VRAGSVGAAQPGVEVRLSPEGEVQVKSPAMMMGYYKAPDLTAEVITEDGFLRTGDRGEIDELGRLRLTGRVKELFKTSKGKYVAPAPIENLLLTSPLLESACVSGLGLPQPFAVVTLSDTARPRAATAEGRAALTGEIGRLQGEINRKLDPHEALEIILIAREPWSVERGLLTPTLKIKRAAVEALYAAKAASLYEGGKPVVWEE
jgi:long-subunit acyl-CoA synthetase (AMP-forming)